jgi:hypothetical protein
MTVETQEAETTGGRAPSPYTERVVTHLTPQVAMRLRMQSALEDRPPAHLADEVLGKGLMTFEEISAQTLQHEKGNGNGTH